MNHHNVLDDERTLPWPDFITGVKRLGLSVFFVIFGGGLLVAAPVNQLYLADPIPDLGPLIIAAGIPGVTLTVILLWNGPYRKRAWMIPVTFLLARIELTLAVIGQVIFWAWAARLHPAFDLLGPSWGENTPAMTALCLITATICAIASLLIGYRNRWFRGLW